MLPFVAVHDLWKSYHAGIPGCSARVRVLEGIGLELRKGERVAVVGPRASGKTTLLHCLCGLRRADRGVIWWLTRDAERWRHLATVPSVSPLSFRLIDVGPRVDNAAAWADTLRASASQSGGWLLVTARVAPFIGLCDRVFHLVEGVLRLDHASGRESRTACRVAEPTRR